MKKIIFVFTSAACLMGGYLANDFLSDTTEKTVQYHDTLKTNVQYKSQPQQPETYQIQREPDPDPETVFDPAKRFEEIENMTQEERAALSQYEKDMFGISDDGKFYTESGSSEEQIEHNK